MRPGSVSSERRKRVARWIDDIVQAVKDHPYISETHKRVLINRIEKPPTREELDQATKSLDES